jgi:hypothetical protein
MVAAVVISELEIIRMRMGRVLRLLLNDVVDFRIIVSAELGQIRRYLPPRDWDLITSLAIGMNYTTIGKNVCATPGNLRIRTMRIRRSLAPIAVQPRDGSQASP